MILIVEDDEEPTPDISACAGHLGEWTEGEESAIRFGDRGRGKPVYVAGPYDDVANVLRTLDRSVGPDGYFVAPVPA